MSIVINVIGQKMYVTSSLECIVAGSQNFVQFRFYLGEEWDGLMTFAQFRQNGKAYNIYLDDNNCVFLPSEIGAGICTLMLYGSNDGVTGTTNYLTLQIDENAIVTDADSTELSESLYNQLVAKVNALQSSINTGVEAVPIYDLDLTSVVSFTTDSTEALDFDISGVCNWDDIETAVSEGKFVRVHFMENNNVREVAVVLTDVYVVNGASTHYLQCVYAPRGGTNYFKLRLEFVDEGESGYQTLLIFTPGMSTTNFQQATGISVTKADKVITVVTTLENDRISTSTITLDDNDYPSMIVTDGVECAVSWMGFDEEA